MLQNKVPYTGPFSIELHTKHDFLKMQIYTNHKKKNKICLSGYAFRQALISHAGILDSDQRYISGSIVIKITKKLIFFRKKQ